LIGNAFINVRVFSLLAGIAGAEQQSSRRRQAWSPSVIAPGAETARSVADKCGPLCQSCLSRACLGKKHHQGNLGRAKTKRRCVVSAGGGWGGDETGGDDVMAQDSSVSMSRFEQRVHGADASVAELLLSSAA
jgi:hypothetical protein